VSSKQCGARASSPVPSIARTKEEIATFNTFLRPKQMLPTDPLSTKQGAGTKTLLSLRTHTLIFMLRFFRLSIDKKVLWLASSFKCHLRGKPYYTDTEKICTVLLQLRSTALML